MQPTSGLGVPEVSVKFQSGGDLYQGALHIVALTALQELHFSGLQLEDPVTLQTHCSILTCLRVLHVSGTRISTNGSEGIAIIFSCLRDLEKLYKSPGWSCYLPDALALATALSQLSKSQHWSLCWFTFGSNEASTLSNSLRGVTGLQTLDFGSSSLSNEGAELVAAQFAYLPCLKSLNVSCSLQPAGLQSVFKQIGFLSSLKSLPAAFDH